MPEVGYGDMLIKFEPEETSVNLPTPLPYPGPYYAPPSEDFRRMAEEALRLVMEDSPLRRAMLGDYDWRYFREGVEMPAADTFRRLVEPTIEGQYTGGAEGAGTYFSGARREASVDAATQLANELAGLRYQEYDAIPGRAAQAYGTAFPTLAQILDMERQASQAEINSRIEAWFAHQGLVVDLAGIEAQLAMNQQTIDQRVAELTTQIAMANEQLRRSEDKGGFFGQLLMDYGTQLSFIPGLNTIAPAIYSAGYYMNQDHPGAGGTSGTGGLNLSNLFSGSGGKNQTDTINTQNRTMTPANMINNVGRSLSNMGATAAAPYLLSDLTGTGGVFDSFMKSFGYYGNDYMTPPVAPTYFPSSYYNWNPTSGVSSSPTFQNLKYYTNPSITDLYPNYYIKALE